MPADVRKKEDVDLQHGSALRSSHSLHKAARETFCHNNVNARGIYFAATTLTTAGKLLRNRKRPCNHVSKFSILGRKPENGQKSSN